MNRKTSGLFQLFLLKYLGRAAWLSCCLNLWYQPGAPTVQFSSDADYPLARPYSLKGLVPQDGHRFRCQSLSPGSPGYLYFCPTWLWIWGFPQPSRKMLYLLLKFIVKNINEQPGEEIHRAKSGRVPLPLWSRACGCVGQLGSPPRPV